ncbi:MAG: cyclic lactone autoinducer peptide [Bacillota bacterium]|nr:cyclic lactone autoinducer peptide [Bacillota bacterium]
MKKLFNLKSKSCYLIKIANLLAVALMISSVNSTCGWIHHQPKVPEAAKKYRKF